MDVWKASPQFEYARSRSHLAELIKEFSEIYMHRRVLCLSALLLSACAAPMLPLQIANINDSASLRITDLRPKQEQLQEHFSLMVFNEAYGKSRISVADVQPPVLRLLQHRAFESLPVALRGGELKVRHLVVYRNMEAAGKSIAASAVAGVVGAVLLEGRIQL